MVRFKQQAFEDLCRECPEIAVQADSRAFYEWMYEQTAGTAKAIVAAETAEKAQVRLV